MLDHVLEANRVDDRVRFASNTILFPLITREKANYLKLPSQKANYRSCSFITLRMEQRNTTILFCGELITEGRSDTSIQVQ